MVSYFDSQYPQADDKFISRNDAAHLLATQIKEKKFSTVYAAPGYGKRTLVGKALGMLKSASYQYTLITLDLFNVTTEKEFCAMYAGAFKKHIEDYNSDALFPITLDLGNLSLRNAINLPSTVASFTGINFVVYFKEFQNIMCMDKGEQLLKLMEKELPGHPIAYIVTGEHANAMKDIFENRKFFYRANCNVPLAPLEKKASMSYLHNGFLRSGKDLEEETGAAIYQTSKGYPMVMNRLAAMCDNMAVGYINRRVLSAAVNAWLEENEPRYRFTMSNLTANQVNFMRAVCDGVQRFSSSEVLKNYNLNSSANVFRLKEALQKKEIVTFDAEDKATVIDPMFENWLKERYFVNRI